MGTGGGEKALGEDQGPGDIREGSVGNENEPKESMEKRKLKRG